jgi:hypothetical protein
VLAVSSWIAIWAVYGFRYSPGPSPDWLFAFHDDAYVQQQQPGLARVVAAIDRWHVLPNAFTQGFLFGQAKASRPVFFAGDYSTSGWWSYFPVAIAIKTPMAILALAIAGLALALVKRRELEGFSVLCVVAPIALFLGAAMASPLNIGVRHVLPVFPLMLLLAGVAVRAAMAARAQAARVALALVVGGGVLETARVYPHTLAFFNALAGGPARGGEYLTDSNLDWGQDLKLLKEWMDANRVTHINLAYFGNASPAYYGMRCTLLPGSTGYLGAANVQLPGYVAISRTILSGVYLGPREREFYAPFKDLAPVASIGHSINVYRLE